MAERREDGVRRVLPRQRSQADDLRHEEVGRRVGFVRDEPETQLRHRKLLAELKQMQIRQSKVDFGEPPTVPNSVPY